MNEAIAQRRLLELATHGDEVFTLSDLATLFGESRGGARLRGTIDRLVKAGTLVRAMQGVYVCSILRKPRVGDARIRDVALAGRRNHVTVEALYSAASRWGLVSQIPNALVTCVTTGRSGRFRTPLGDVVYTHTDMPLSVLHKCSVYDGSRLLLADRNLTIETLRRTGMNHVYDIEEDDWDDAEEL